MYGTESVECEDIVLRNDESQEWNTDFTNIITCVAQ